MQRKMKWIVVAGLTIALVGGGTRLAVASADDDGSDKPITGPALQRASAAALQHTGGGRVTGTEVGDEESLYEVEVTRPDGTEVDVQLDKGFKVVGTDTDRPGDDDGQD